MEYFHHMNHICREKRRLEQRLKPLSKEYDLRMSDIELLLFLHSTPDCRTAGDAAERQMLPKSLVSASVDLLTERGLLARMPDSRDKRRTILELSPACDAIIDQAQALLSEKEDNA